uniref:Uncharacterized protein n=1 Tax=Tetranychus urticae TaxID=32264 RepID=T1JWU3_TETUR
MNNDSLIDLTNHAVICLFEACIALKGYIKSKTEKRSESLGSCDSIVKRLLLRFYF